VIETNIQVVCPDRGFQMRVKYAEVKGSSLSLDLVERACGMLRYRHGLAAIPVSGDLRRLLVSTSSLIPSIHMQDEEWELDVSDSGEKTMTLTLTDPNGERYLSQLLERALMGNLARNSQLWSLDSPRIWYERSPFRVKDGIAAYRRYQIAAVLLDEEGIGIAVDVGTAFFTTESLAYFCDPNTSTEERSRRERLFAKLTNRQAGQKGTLLYDNGVSKMKCYFESAPQGITCATTGRLRVKGQTYQSLHEYYKKENPRLAVEPDAPAVQVSFRNIKKPQWVAAEQVVIRVMNDSVPRRLSSVDKIDPKERRELIEGFWAGLGDSPFGPGLPRPRYGFWRPQQDRVSQFALPKLSFGRQGTLDQPSASAKAYQENYRSRLEYMEEFGCYHVPPDMPRTIHFAYPSTLDRKACEQLAKDLTQTIQNWASCSVEAIRPISYATVSEAIDSLRRAQESGLVVFVLNKEPVAYHEVSFQLEGWRVKRITDGELTKHYGYLQEGAYNSRSKQLDLARGKKRWRDFVSLNALGVLQLLEVVPFRFDQAGDYEAQLFVDVGHDRRHFALSLLIARSEDKKPNFHIVSDVQVKTDLQHEAINPRILADEIVKLLDRAIPHRGDPLESLLILRDGRFCGNELQGIDDAVSRLIAAGTFEEDGQVDRVDFRKDTQKSVRFWDVDDGSNSVSNPLDGTAVRLNRNAVVVAATGATTLHQGTAQPFAVTGNAEGSDPVEAARAAFLASQLNWSSPSVAQRLPLYAKRADDELRARADQEIKRFD